MKEMLVAADRLLRGDLTPREELSQGRIAVSSGLLALLGAAGGAIYGLAMGLFGVLRPEHATWKQCAADALKVPLLFLLTLLVAFPSLYAFSALANSKLRFVATLKLLLAPVAVNLLLLASFAPVTAFFTVSTTSYSFMVLLNVALFAVSGSIALAILGRALDAVYAKPPRPQTAPAEQEESEAARLQRQRALREEWGRWERENGAPRRVFRTWLAIYALVGCQMAWILRPFIGTPDLEFQLFRERGGSFFEAVFRSLLAFLIGE